jgi:hypothetical protein
MTFRQRHSQNISVVTRGSPTMCLYEVSVPKRPDCSSCSRFFEHQSSERFTVELSCAPTHWGHPSAGARKDGRGSHRSEGSLCLQMTDLVKSANPHRTCAIIREFLTSWEYFQREDPDQRSRKQNHQVSVRKETGREFNRLNRKVREADAPGLRRLSETTFTTAFVEFTSKLTIRHITKS